MKKQLLLMLIILICFLTTEKSAKALEQKIGLAVDQAVFNLAVAPGETATFPVKIENVSNITQRIMVTSSDAIMGEQNSFSELTPRNELFGLADWLTFDNSNLFLSPAEKKVVNVSLKVPAEASVGSHYGAVLIRALPEISGENFQQVLVGGQIAVTVLTNVKGEVSGKGKVKSFSAPIISGKKAELSAEFENEGNIHYIPHGEISIRNFFSTHAQSLALDKHFVFPGKSFNFTTDWSLPSLFGIYVAKAAFVDGDGMIRTSQKIIFGDLAFVPMLGMLALIIVIGKILYGRIRQRV